MARDVRRPRGWNVAAVASSGLDQALVTHHRVG